VTLSPAGIKAAVEALKVHTEGEHLWFEEAVVPEVVEAYLDALPVNEPLIPITEREKALHMAAYEKGLRDAIRYHNERQGCILHALGQLDPFREV
jgi:hypothetical protein